MDFDYEDGIDFHVGCYWSDQDVRHGGLTLICERMSVILMICAAIETYVTMLM